MIPLPLTTAHCLGVIARAAAPRRLLSVSAWADAHRELTSKQSGEPGRWRTARNPELAEIMDCLSPQSPVTDIVVKKSSQRGVTEVVVNFIGYTMHHAPRPVMVLMPTLEARDKWKIQKLNPLFTDTPAVRDLLGGIRSRDAANRADVVDFPGGVLFLAGGNSPNSYAQITVYAIILDDLDRFPTQVGEEGDPVDLAEGRTKSLARYKRLLISTPTIKDASLIDREWQASDMRERMLPCPHCGEWQVLEWGGPDKPYGIKWSESPDGIVTAAWYLCIHCAAEIHEHHKPAMLAAGRWVPRHPERKKRGYHLTALTSPIGLGPSWLDLAIKWHAAIKSPAKLQVFVNTDLGEVWEEPGDQVDPTGLMARLEDYPDPIPIVARTVFVDVQKDRLEATSIGWAEGEEAWVLDHTIIPGDTARPEPWTELDDLFADIRPDAAGIDSGYNTSMVYAFCNRHAYCYATKGAPGPGRPIVEDERARRRRLRRQRKKGIQVHLIGVDQAKALIFARLNLRERGPGYVHFPNDATFDDEYFAQLTAEKLVTKIRGTRPFAEWVQTRPRNEALDCFVGNLAVLRLRGLNLKAMALAAAARAAGEAQPAAPRVVARRIGRIGSVTRFT